MDITCILLYIWIIIIVNFFLNMLLLWHNTNHLQSDIHINNQSLATINAISLSIIIPCRNEESNLSLCLTSFLNNNNPKNLEIILINDNSTDHTFKIMQNYQKMHNSIKIIDLHKKPNHWVGKSYACWKGAKEAKGDKLLFLDADTQITDINKVIKLAQNNKSFIFAFAKYTNKTVGEKIMVPFKINFWFLFVMPMYFMNFNWRIANAIGYFIMVDKNAYFRSGGHKQIKDSIVDDISLAQNFVKHKYKITPIAAQSFLETRMYESFNAAWNGSLRNYYAIFQKNILFASLCWLIVYFFFTFPFLTIFYNLNISLILIIILVILHFYYLLFTTNKFSIKDKILAFIGIFANLACCIQSFIIGVSNKEFAWKDRKI